jgi:hypothetical protein
MNKYVLVVLLFLWAVFLVLIGTFGGQPGSESAGTAAVLTALGLWFWWLGKDD